MGLHPPVAGSSPLKLPCHAASSVASGTPPIGPPLKTSDPSSES